MYKFKSKAAGDLIMLDTHGRKLLTILGKHFPEQQTQGILTVEQMPQALLAIEAAIAADEGVQADSAQEADAPEEGRANTVGLRQRLLPFVTMVRRCMQARQPIVWGV